MLAKMIQSAIATALTSSDPKSSFRQAFSDGCDHARQRGVLTPPQALSLKEQAHPIWCKLIAPSDGTIMSAIAHLLGKRFTRELSEHATSSGHGH
jgi:hypothetical protein